jgi:hypothetical protein
VSSAVELSILWLSMGPFHLRIRWRDLPKGGTTLAQHFKVGYERARTHSVPKGTADLIPKRSLHCRRRREETLIFIQGK